MIPTMPPPVPPAVPGVDARWRRSSFCSGADTMCVEVAMGERSVAVRDSKDPAGPILAFTHDEWLIFLHGVRAGEFIPPT